MRAFIAVFAIVLLAFGASILYYRGDFGPIGKNPTPTSTDQTANTSTVGIPANPSSAFNIAQGPSTSTNTTGNTISQTANPPTYVSLSVTPSPIGSIKVGDTKDLKAMAKDKSGVLVNVNATWTVVDSGVGDLSNSQGTSTTFTAKKVGKTKVTATYQDLMNTVDVSVIAKTPVLGAATDTTGTGTTASVKPAVTPVEIRLYDTNGTRLNNGDTRNYTAQVFYSDGSLKSVDVNWSVDPGDLGTLSRTKGSSVDFKASRTGNGNLKATLGNLSASLYIQVN